MHSDSPMVYQSYMRARKTELTVEDAWLLANLMVLPYPTNSSGASYDRGAVTQRLLEVCAAHSVLRRVTRLSMVRKLGKSNRLQVISSANTSDGPNLMPIDYCCFVDASGSLFHIKPMSLRYFTDAGQVVASYASRHRPAQRSISRVAAMQLGGGLCKGVFSNDQLVGFIFLNGHLTQAELDSNNIAMLVEFICVALRPYYEPFALSQAYWTLAASAGDVFVGRRLSLQVIEELVVKMVTQLTGRRREITVSGDLPARALLVSHGSVAQFIARSIAAGPARQSLEVRVGVNQDSLHFDHALGAEWTDLPEQTRLFLTEMARDATAVGIHWSMVGDHALLTMPADYASSDPSVDYSVEVEHPIVA